MSEFKLRSAAVDLTIHEPLIYVSTAYDSLSILRVDDGRLVEVFR